MSDTATYVRAIDQAKANLADLRERETDAIGGDAIELMRGILTPEEVSASELRIAMMIELVNARKERGISQKKLEELSGVKQPIIARMEKGNTIPQIDTVLKVLAPLGKTLAVVPLDKMRQFDGGYGDYTAERDDILKDISLSDVEQELNG